MRRSSIGNIVHRGLTRQLLLPVLAFLVLLGSFSVWLELRQVNKVNLLVARSMASYLETFLQDAFMALEEEQLPGDAGEPPGTALAAHMAEILRGEPHFLRLLRVEPDGHTSLAVPQGQGLPVFPPYSLLQGTPYVESAGPGRVILSRPHMSAGAEMVVHLGVRRQGGWLLAAELSLEGLSRHLARLDPGRLRSVIVADAFGNVVMHPRMRLLRTQANIGDSKLFRAAVAGQRTLLFRDWSPDLPLDDPRQDGRYMLGANAIIRPEGWVVMVQGPAGGLLAPALLPVAATFVFLSCILILATHKVRRSFQVHIVTPLYRLAEALSRVGKGRYQPLETMPSFRELDIVEESLERMAARIEDRERRLLQHGQLFRAIFDHAAMGLVRCDPSGRFEEVNQYFCDTCGYTREELQAMTYREITHPDDLPQVEANILALLDGQIGVYSQEKRYVTKAGAIVWVHIAISLERDAKGGPRHFIGVVENVSDRRAAQEALGASELRYRTLFEQSLDGIAIIEGLPPMFTYVNAAFCELFGLKVEDIWGKSTDEALQLVHPEDRAMVHANLMERMTGQVTESRYEFRLLRHDGQVRWVSVSGKRLQQGDMPMNQCIYRDVTESRSIRQQLQESLREKEILLREVHHRVKNNLQIISGLLHLQSASLAGTPAAEALDLSRNRIQAIAQVHEELYRADDFSGVDLKQHAQSLASRIVESLRGSGGVRCELELSEIRVPLDKAVPFGLILNELLTNAVKHGLAGRSDGQIRVRLERQGDTVRLTVADNGKGLPENFDPLQSTTLGMQLVVSLTEQLGGSLSLECDGGTCIVMEFPCPAPQARPAGPLPEGSAPGRP